MPEDDFKGHRTPEQRIAANEPIALFEDLENLEEGELLVIAQECDEDADPDACVACRAYAMWMDLQQEALSSLANPTGPPPGFPYDEGRGEEDDVDDGTAVGEIHEQYQESAPEEPYFDPEPDEDDLRQFFIDKVEDLHLAVRRLMEGPPIPPPNVTLADLALLTIGSREWIKSCKQQAQMGFVLSPERAKIAEQVERLLGRIDQ